MSEVTRAFGAGDVERIPACDLDHAGNRLQLVRHIAAMANSGGGTLVLGARRNGTVVGLTAEVAVKLNEAKLAEIAADYLHPDHVDLTAASIAQLDDKQVVEVTVRGHREPPLVMARGGRIDESADGAADNEIFAANQVVVRRNGRTETARRDDHLRWRHEALADLRRELQERLGLVLEAPAGATVRVMSGGEVLDEPSYFLDRSTDLFRLQPEQLLSSRDLVYLWLHRATLDVDDDAARLVVQSALRKRATLYLWLAVLPVSDEQIRRMLFEAVTMRDRDKSDAARAVLAVCALYFDAETYDALVADLRASGYAHMREATDALPDIDQARIQLDNERLTNSSQAQLVSAPGNELFDQVDQLLARGGSPPRRVPSFGLELLTRKLDRRIGDQA